jgi:hypothetical protein
MVYKTKALFQQPPEGTMASWHDRSITFGDVVFFRYQREDIEKTFDEVFVWDLDKTYLDTNWGSVRDLWRTAIEKAFQKRNVPGTNSMVRALSESWIEFNSKAVFPIYFITASPPQMEEKIREKLELDNIKPVGSFYKDNLRNLRPGRFRRLTQQIGFKLQALMQLRLRLNPNVRQVFWGDDSEADAIIYSLYSDICARRHSEKQLQAILMGLHVGGEQLDVILDLQDQTEVSDPVEKIYINLATDTDPEYYIKFGRRLLPTHNSFQVALDLYQDGRLDVTQVVRVGRDLSTNYGFTLDELDRSLDDLVRRQVLSAPAFASVSEPLKLAGIISSGFKPSIEPLPIAEMKGRRVFRLEGAHEPWIPESIDYLNESR